MLWQVLALKAIFIGSSTAALVATGIVAIGLYLEYERYEGRRRRIGNLLVVIGVALEALFGLVAFTSASVRESRDEVQIAMLNREAAQLAKDSAMARVQIATANERTVNAERALERERTARLQLEQKVAWRHLDGEQRRQLVTAFKPLAGRTVSIAAQTSDPEASGFAKELEGPLRAAGLKIVEDFGVYALPSAVVGIELDVIMHKGAARPDSLGEARLIERGLRDAKIACCSVAPFSFWGEYPNVLVRIFVGAKPP